MQAESLRSDKGGELQLSANRNSLVEISRPVGVESPANRNVIGQQLERDDFQQWEH